MTFEISRLNNQYDIAPKPYPLEVIATEMRKGTSSLHDLHDKALARNVREATQHARELLKTNHRGRYDQIKKEMPQILPALITESRSPADDVAYSRLVCLEYDDEDVDADYAIYLFSQNPHVVLAWRSLSGKPKALISVEDQAIDGTPLDVKTFAHAWLTAAIMFEEIGDADIGAMRPTQTQNLCHDPDLFHNPNPIPLKWSIDNDALRELEETTYKGKRKPPLPGSIAKLDPRYIDAIADMEFNNRGHGKKLLPCPFAHHEHDDWDNRFKRNATRITKHKNGDITLRCFKCDTSKKFFARQDTEVTPATIEQAPPIEVRHTASFRHFTPEEKTVICEVLGENPDAGWIPAGDKNIPAWIPKYQNLHGLTGEFALNGQPAEVEKRRVWLSEFTTCDHCGSITAKWIDRYLITTGVYCDGCHKDYPIGSYLEYELHRKLPNAVISTSDARYLSDDPEFADFRLWEPGVLTYLASAMGTGKSTEIYKLMARLAQQGIGKGIIAVPRISLARFLAHYLRRKDGSGAWGLWHEGAPPSEKFIGKYGAICCVPSLPAVLAEAEGTNAYIAIDEIDFAYALLSLTVAQATKVKQILREAVATTGLVVAGQTESTLALEAFAAEIDAEQVQGFYKNATPSEIPVEVYQYPDVEGKNSLVLAGAETAITTALAAGKNVYTFCTTRREAEILEKHFSQRSPVIYDSYTKGYEDADAVLKNQRLTDSDLFIATSAAGIGISILDDKAYTVQVASLLFGSLRCADIVQQHVRDRGRCGGSIHIGQYQFRLPVKPSEQYQKSLYHEALKKAENAHVFLPEHSIQKIAAAEALSTLADTQPETFLKYHLGTVARMPLVFEEGNTANEEQIERITVTRSTLRKEERARKQKDAITLLESDAPILTSEDIRRQSNTGQLLKTDRLAQELANLALQASGWKDDENETADAEVVDMAKALIEVSGGFPIANLEKQRRGFYAVQFPTWTAHALIADREFAYRDLTEIGAGVELTSVTDDRFIGELLKALLGKLAGVPWTKSGFADAVREILHSEVTKHEGCKETTFMDNLLRGAAGARLYRTSRFLNLADDPGIIKWTSQLISEWYPARIAKRGDAYGLHRHEHYDLILQCFRLWGDQQLHPPDRWDIHAYETADLPDPNAEAIKQAREMRKEGKAFSEIMDAVGTSYETVRRWCKGINKNAKKIAEAKALEKEGMPRKDIAKELGTSTKFLTRHLGPKSPKKGQKT